jgi:hypothetical protein
MIGFVLGLFARQVFDLIKTLAERLRGIRFEFFLGSSDQDELRQQQKLKAAPNEPLARSIIAQDDSIGFTQEREQELTKRAGDP